MNPASRFEELGRLFLETSRSPYPVQVAEAARLIGDALDSGGKLLVFGNGGSAADAQHLAGELVVKFQTSRRALPAIALVCDSAILTACANDVSFDTVFSRQIEAFGAPGDIALGISTSGRSPNVICALQSARTRGLKTMLLTGPDPGRAREFADVLLCAPGNNTARIQEVHLASYHLICEILDQRFSAQ